MAIKAEVHTGGSGDGEDLRTSEGVHPFVLAEVVDRGREQNKWGKTYQQALAIIEIGDEVCGENAPELAGTPKQVYWWINNMSFSNADSAEYRSAWELQIAAWFGKSVPAAKQGNFLFGREYGGGPDDLTPGLKGAALKKEREEKPGVPIGATGLVRVVHVERGGKVYAQPAPAFPTKDIEPSELAKWVPGFQPPDAAARKLKVSKSYVPWAERVKSNDGGDEGKAEAAAALDDDEDFEIPF